jgi:hypothetical protein
MNCAGLPLSEVAEVVWFEAEEGGVGLRSRPPPVSGRHGSINEFGRIHCNSIEREMVPLVKSINLMLSGKGVSKDIGNFL